MTVMYHNGMAYLYDPMGRPVCSFPDRGANAPDSNGAFIDAMKRTIEDSVGSITRSIHAMYNGPCDRCGEPLSVYEPRCPCGWWQYPDCDDWGGAKQW